MMCRERELKLAKNYREQRNDLNLGDALCYADVMSNILATIQPEPVTVPDVDAVMAKAQEFASAWALVGGRFDDGSMMEEAEARKAELRAMLAAQQPEAQHQVVDGAEQGAPKNYKKLAEWLEHENACLRKQISMQVAVPAALDGDALIAKEVRDGYFTALAGFNLIASLPWARSLIQARAQEDEIHTKLVVDNQNRAAKLPMKLDRLRSIAQQIMDRNADQGKIIR